MKKFLFINLIFISYASPNCSMTFFKNTIYIGSKNNLKKSDVIKSTNCQEAISSKFHQIVINSAGTLKSKYLKSIDPSINYYPEHFHLTPLKEILREKMGPSNEERFTKIRFMNNTLAIHLKEDQLLDIPKGFKTGNMAFTLELLGKSGKSESIWIEAVGTKLLEVYVASLDLMPTNDDLSSALFKKVKRNITNQNLYFIDDKTLSFHKLNRTLKAGEILKKSFLIKKNLVSFGTPAKITYQKGSLVLTGMGLPLSTGRFGDFVKLKNPRNKNIIFGKVNGPNSVLVGL
ncbi:MAG: flagella basal body P-ring formation protein FlgA [Epsilonproteobacteria bacterium]|nr:MAG: flagella basal body P-ring formation protein FlgA [Campylobacterota bacterium]RLA67517.1 MAG: flagella basal body P-ring formation protein FlgA [Campylobacterota bacterium]